MAASEKLIHGFSLMSELFRRRVNVSRSVLLMNIKGMEVSVKVREGLTQMSEIQGNYIIHWYQTTKPTEQTKKRIVLKAVVQRKH